MRTLLIILTFTLFGCTAQQTEQRQQQGPGSDFEFFMDSGLKQLSARNTKKAIIEFDKAIDTCEAQYADQEEKVYESRGPTESLYYLIKAASEKQAAISVAPYCGEALYLRSYSSLDIGEVDLAKNFIERAIDISPLNSVYLSELGHIYHSKRDWENALDIFTQAEEAANGYSPPELKDIELSRAKRGVGYSLIELGRLIRAEEKFRECLEIDENDKDALRELKYIEELRAGENRS